MTKHKLLEVNTRSLVHRASFAKLKCLTTQCKLLSADKTVSVLREGVCVLSAVLRSLLARPSDLRPFVSSFDSLCIYVVSGKALSCKAKSKRLYVQPT